MWRKFPKVDNLRVSLWFCRTFIRPVTNLTKKRPGIWLRYNRLVLVSYVTRMLVASVKIIKLKLALHIHDHLTHTHNYIYIHTYIHTHIHTHALCTNTHNTHLQRDLSFSYVSVKDLFLFL
jgi:hypothetical protein